jgi:hypothetical protein
MAMEKEDQGAKRSVAHPRLFGSAPEQTVRHCAMSVLRWLVAKRETTTGFFVELTDYGWSVRTGTERLGLFVTQQQALRDVKKRREVLTARGHDSTLVVTGSELSSVAGSRSRS